MMTKILIIDDNEDIRFTIKEICQFSNWRVIEAETGYSGVQYFLKASPDLVLVDYHLSQWDGVKTVREIRAINPSVPLLVLTVEDRQEVADKFFAAGATDFALKPIKAPDLLSRIRLNLKTAKLLAKQREIIVDKGINPDTLGTIKKFMIKRETPLTINEIEKHVPISYQTIHRYLNHLVESDVVDVIVEYGKVGRPKNKYIFKSL
ncbi:response regulator [Pullulanibacillus camelliae]|nr:response regulator [Pullulanibacillus camelliae]